MLRQNVLIEETLKIAKKDKKLRKNRTKVWNPTKTSKS